MESRRVLIVEDDAMVRVLLSMQLEHGGYQVRTARGVWEGLMTAVAWPPDVIISDIIMPEQNGTDLLIELRKRTQLAKVPVVLISAGPAPGSIEDHQARFLSKEAIAEHLLPLVSELMVHNREPGQSAAVAK